MANGFLNLLSAGALGAIGGGRIATAATDPGSVKTEQQLTPSPSPGELALQSAAARFALGTQSPGVSKVIDPSVDHLARLLSSGLATQYNVPLSSQDRGGLIEKLKTMFGGSSLPDSFGLGGRFSGTGAGGGWDYYGTGGGGSPGLTQGLPSNWVPREGDPGGGYYDNSLTQGLGPSAFVPGAVPAMGGKGAPFEIPGGGGLGLAAPIAGGAAAMLLGTKQGRDLIGKLFGGGDAVSGDLFSISDDPLGGSTVSGGGVGVAPLRHPIGQSKITVENIGGPDTLSDRRAELDIIVGNARRRLLERQLRLTPPMILDPETGDYVPSVGVPGMPPFEIPGGGVPVVDPKAYEIPGGGYDPTFGVASSSPPGGAGVAPAATASIDAGAGAAPWYPTDEYDLWNAGGGGGAGVAPATGAWGSFTKPLGSVNIPGIGQVNLPSGLGLTGMGLGLASGLVDDRGTKAALQAGGGLMSLLGASAASPLGFITGPLSLGMAAYTALDDPKSIKGMYERREGAYNIGKDKAKTIGITVSDEENKKLLSAAQTQEGTDAFHRDIGQFSNDALITRILNLKQKGGRALPGIAPVEAELQRRGVLDQARVMLQQAEDIETAKIARQTVEKQATETRLQSITRDEDGSLTLTPASRRALQRFTGDDDVDFNTFRKLSKDKQLKILVNTRKIAEDEYDGQVSPELLSIIRNPATWTPGWTPGSGKPTPY